METKVKHEMVYDRKFSTQDWLCECSCGAHWTQDKSKTPEDLFDIYKRHVRGYEKKTEVL